MTGKVQTPASSQQTAKNMDSISGEYGHSGISESRDLSTQDSVSKKLHELRRSAVIQWHMNQTIRDSKLAIFPGKTLSILPIGTSESSPVDQYYLHLNYFTETNILRRNTQNISDESLKRILYEMGLGIAYLHRNNILHRDIHSSSFLINPRNQVKIINQENAAYGPLAFGFYGCGFALLEILVLHNFRMTPLFTFSDDMFALGVTIYILNYGDLPYTFPGYVYYPYQLPDKNLQSLLHSLLHEEENLEYIVPPSKETAALSGTVTPVPCQVSEDPRCDDSTSYGNGTIEKTETVESTKVPEENSGEEKKKKKKPFFRRILSRLNPIKKRKQKKSKTLEEKQVSLPHDKSENAADSAGQFFYMNAHQLKFSDEFQGKSESAKATGHDVRPLATSSSGETTSEPSIRARPQQTTSSKSFATSLSRDGRPKLLNALKQLKMAPGAVVKLPAIEEETGSSISSLKIIPPPPSKSTNARRERPVLEEVKEEFVACWDAFGQEENWADDSVFKGQCLNSVNEGLNALKFESDFNPFHQEENWPESTCHEIDLFQASSPWGEITQLPSLGNESETFDDFFAKQNSVHVNNAQVDEFYDAGSSLTVKTAECSTIIQKPSETTQATPVEEYTVKNSVQQKVKKNKRHFGWLRKLICGFNKKQMD